MVGGWEKWKWETGLELESAFSRLSTLDLFFVALPFHFLLSFSFASPVNHFLCVCVCVCVCVPSFFLKEKKMGGLGKTICKIAVYCRIFFFSKKKKKNISTNIIKNLLTLLNSNIVNVTQFIYYKTNKIYLLNLSS